jgi:SAM-dependent methyltransferase
MVSRATDTAVRQLVAAVAEEAGTDLHKRRDVLQQQLAGLTITDQERRAWRDGVDIIGTAYETLFTGEQRRDQGQFFTPFWAGEVMAGWLYEKPTELVLDPGCGSGGLLIPAARHGKRHEAKLLGLDLDPLAISMLAANARLRGMNDVVGRQTNFLLDELPEAPTAIICNPPYSRHHVIPTAEKLAIHDGFEKRLGVRFNGLAALHVLFLVRALEVAADGARIAFITPSDWLDVGYGKKIKEFLLARAQVDAIVLVEESHLFFDGVLTTAAITLIRKTTPADEPTTVIRIGGDPTRTKPQHIVDGVAGRLTLDGIPIESVRLNAQAKWSRPKPQRRSGAKLGSVARVRRGIATGANSYFILSEAQRTKLGIPVEQLRRCITSPRVFTDTDLTGEAMDALPDDVPRWLIDCGDEDEPNRDTPLGRYLRRGQGRTLRINKGYLTAKRNPWHRQEQRGDSPILFTYFNRDAPRFVRNRCGAVPLNNWLIVEPKQTVDADSLFRALQRKGVLAQLLEGRRIYGGGLWKLEPSELVEVRVSGKLTGGGPSSPASAGA